MRALAALTLPAVFVLPAAVPPAAGSEAVPQLSVLRLRGEFVARLAPPPALPLEGGLPAFPPGTEVQVSSGQVVFGVGPALVRAEGGESFGYHAVEGEIWLFGPVAGGPVDVEVGAARAVLRPGTALALAPGAGGRVALRSLNGDVALVSRRGWEQTLSAFSGRPVTVLAAAPAGEGHPGLPVVTTWEREAGSLVVSVVRNLPPRGDAALRSAPGPRGLRAQLRVFSFDGILQVASPHRIVSFGPGALVPELTPGARLVVVSGAATVDSAGRVRRLGPGEWVRIPGPK